MVVKQQSVITDDHLSIADAGPLYSYLYDFYLDIYNSTVNVDETIYFSSFKSSFSYSEPFSSTEYLGLAGYILSELLSTYPTYITTIKALTMYIDYSTLYNNSAGLNNKLDELSGVVKTMNTPEFIDYIESFNTVDKYSTWDEVKSHLDLLIINRVEIDNKDKENIRTKLLALDKLYSPSISLVDVSNSVTDKGVIFSSDYYEDVIVSLISEIEILTELVIDNIETYNNYYMLESDPTLDFTYLDINNLFFVGTGDVLELIISFNTINLTDLIATKKAFTILGYSDTNILQIADTINLIKILLLVINNYNLLYKLTSTSKSSFDEVAITAILALINSSYISAESEAETEQIQEGIKVASTGTPTEYAALVNTCLMQIESITPEIMLSTRSTVADVSTRRLATLLGASQSTTTQLYTDLVQLNTDVSNSLNFASSQVRALVNTNEILGEINNTTRFINSIGYMVIDLNVFNSILNDEICEIFNTLCSAAKVINGIDSFITNMISLGASLASQSQARFNSIKSDLESFTTFETISSMCISSNDLINAHAPATRASIEGILGTDKADTFNECYLNAMTSVKGSCSSNTNLSAIVSLLWTDTIASAITLFSGLTDNTKCQSYIPAPGFVLPRAPIFVPLDFKLPRFAIKPIDCR